MTKKVRFHCKCNFVQGKTEKKIKTSLRRHFYIQFFSNITIFIFYIEYTIISSRGTTNACPPPKLQFST